MDGVRPGAYFEGRATVRFTPMGRRAKSGMTFWFGREQLEPTAISRAYFFTLRGPDLAQQLGLTAAPAVPLSEGAGYDECKRAFRQLGLRPLHAFLNRDGRSRGTTFVVFPLEATRRSGSSDALMLYAFDPALKNAVVLSAGGHAEVAEDPRIRYFFFPLIRDRSATRRWEPQGRVHSYANRLSMPKRLTSTDLETTIRFTPGAGTRALELTLNPRLKVSAVTRPDGAALPFAQWAFVGDGVNPDPTVVVDLQTAPPAGQELSITVAGAGPLFDAFGPNWVLADEDNWYAQLDDPEGAEYELVIEVPKIQVPVAPGQKLSDEVVEGVRTVRYRTTRPQKRSTLYVGPFEIIKGEADGTQVEVYSDRHRPEAVVGYDEFMGMEITSKGTSKADVDYSRQEIENALKVYKKILGPIDLEVLRVASTPTGHGRGFEGLLLLSKFGGFDSDDSRADLFRAHEVAHLWWGNQVDVLDWREDRWLGESFAEYVAMEFYTIRFKDPAKTREWMQQKWVQPVLGATREPVSTLDGQRRRVRSSELRPLVDGTQNVYTKGPLVIHMLRNLFVVLQGSDEKFWELLQDFLEQHKGGFVTTEEFIDAAEIKLGGKIPWFWDQWLYGSELPHVRWSQTTEQQGQQWLVTVEARQEGTAFSLPVPVYVELSDGRRARQFLDLSGATGRTVLKVPAKPKSVSVNDNFEVLAFIEKE